jgi:hypothetical protein
MNGAGRHALLIGVNRYPNFGPRQQLLGCINDVEVMAALLSSSCGFEDAVTLCDDEATREGILAALEVSPHALKTTTPWSSTTAATARR